MNIMMTLPNNCIQTSRHFIMKIRQNIIWAHLSFYHAWRADGHIWTTCSASLLLMQCSSWILSVKETTVKKYCRPSTVINRNTTDDVQRLSVAHWWRSGWRFLDVCVYLDDSLQTWTVWVAHLASWAFLALCFSFAFSTKGINCWYSANVFSSSMMKGR